MVRRLREAEAAARYEDEQQGVLSLIPGPAVCGRDKTQGRERRPILAPSGAKTHRCRPRLRPARAARRFPAFAGRRPAVPPSKTTGSLAGWGPGGPLARQGVLE